MIRGLQQETVSNGLLWNEVIASLKVVHQGCSSSVVLLEQVCEIKFADAAIGVPNLHPGQNVSSACIS
jgi:hypothetical protein